MSNFGVKSMGIKCPIIHEGDDIQKIVVDSVLTAMAQKTPTGSIPGYYLQDRDVIGITESVIARAQGNYATVDEIAADVIKKFGKDATIALVNPIFSRNRFAIILRGVARAAKKLIIFMPDVDEVGNVRNNHPFTGMNYDKYYQDLCAEENCKCEIRNDKVTGRDLEFFCESHGYKDVLYCGLHDYQTVKNLNLRGIPTVYTLADILSDKCEYGVLGSNKASEERIKLFPNKAKGQALVEAIQAEIKAKTGANVSVMAYGDGGFKDPVGGIWEFADPVVSPFYTKELEGTPNEIKLKAFAESMTDDDVKSLIKQAHTEGESLVGSMASQGTTPRRFTDLLGSLMDLTSGSGDKGTPVVLVQNYFTNYTTE